MINEIHVLAIVNFSKRNTDCMGFHMSLSYQKGNESIQWALIAIANSQCHSNTDTEVSG